MTRVAKTFIALALALAVGACQSRTERTDGGGVLLSIEDFDGLPFLVSVNGGIIQIEEVTLANVPKQPGGATSALMNVEVHSYEITYTRADAGTRIPVPFIRGMFGVAPVNGTAVFENLPIVGLDQLENLPLSDLLFENGGIDTETGEDRIALNLRLRFFGRTLSGDEVESAPAAFTIDFTP
jgi:hypothetical protein